MATDTLKLEVLVCPDCKARFGLSVGTGRLTTSDRLPEVFEATCPHCSHISKFAKSSIQTIKL